MDIKKTPHKKETENGVAWERRKTFPPAGREQGKQEHAPQENFRAKKENKREVKYTNPNPLSIT